MPRRGSRLRAGERQSETKQRRAPVGRSAARRCLEGRFAGASRGGAFGLTRRQLSTPPRPHSAGRLLVRRLFWACLSVGFVCLLPALAAQSAPGEAEVKAALVYNFAKFVEWPDDADPQGRPVVVGVLGDPELTAIIDRTLRNKTVRGRTFDVRHFTSIDSPALCHILFVALQDAAAVKRTIHVVQDSPTLTIGELHGFSGWGGVIELVLEEKQFRFEINAGTARRGGLKVSSRLLRLARSVKGN
ncbi:MAG: YfiR family protein [Bryobacterales bacterium]